MLHLTSSMNKNITWLRLCARSWNERKGGGEVSLVSLIEIVLVESKDSTGERQERLMRENEGSTERRFRPFCKLIWRGRAQVYKCVPRGEWDGFVKRRLKSWGSELKCLKELKTKLFQLLGNQNPLKNVRKMRPLSSDPYQQTQGG